jgi:hypothetical protein
MRAGEESENQALGMTKSFLFVGCGGATRVVISAVGG